MIRKALFVLFALFSPIVSAATINVNAGMSEATIQGLVNGGVTGVDTVVFAAGTYNWSTPLIAKCGLIYQGPTATPPTAIINNTGGGTNLWRFGTCTTQTTWQYITEVGGAIYADISNHSNVSFLHDQFLSIPGDSVCGTGSGNVACEAGIVFDGTYAANNSVSNVLLEYNAFGDSNSCTSNLSGNHGGSCAGYFSQTSVVTNFTAKYNTFTHLEEGLHILYGSGFNYSGGIRASTMDNVDIEYNTYGPIHRNFVEVQMQVINHPTVVSHNLFTPPINPYFDTLTLSAACCQFGSVTGTTTISPALILQDNMEYNNLPSSSNSSFFQEMWGNGSLSENNVLQGSSCNGVAWGYVGQVAMQINYDLIQGPWMASQAKCNVSPIASAYILNEESQSLTPLQTGNRTSSTPTALTSVAPSISPTPTGTYSAPVTVTITIPVSTTSIPSGLNTVAYYTTDGSTPTTSSTQCNIPPATSCTFTVAQGSTVNAISMWGYKDSNFTQVTSAFPSGYGYVQSGVKSAHYVSSGGGGPTLTGVTLTLTGGGSSVQVGKSIQAIANCSYTGPQTTNCTTTDAFGTTASSWASSDVTKASISSSGLVTGLAAGTTNLTVHAGSFSNSGSPFALTVTAAAPVFQNVTLSCPTPIGIGQTSTCTATCNYSGPQALNCTTTDAQGNVASGWASSNTAVATVSGNVATGVAAGTTNITASAAGSPSQPVQITVNPNPPAATLAGVTVGCTNGFVQAGSTTPCTATCSYSDLTTTNCTTTDSHGKLAGNWNSSVPADATINSTTGILSGVAVGSTDVTAIAGATSSVIANSKDDTLTGWSLCIIGSCGGGTPGGTNPPASTSQTINNASPSLDGGSMLISETTIATSTQTNALWSNKPGACDSCRNFIYDLWVYPTWGSQAPSSLEYDMGNFDVTDNIAITFGGQCLLSSHIWQISNQTSGWSNTSVSCSALTPSTWHHIQYVGHANLTTEFFDSVTIDGVVGTIGTTLPTTTLPGGFTSTVYSQAQIDIGATTSAQTVSEYIDEDTLQASDGFISPPVTIPVTSAPAQTVLGNNQVNLSLATYPNYNQSVYAVEGSAPTQVSQCSVNLGTGAHAAGKHWDCGLILAPTATTQATSWLCHATYTTLGTSADAGWHTLNIVNCGTLSNVAYWVAVNTDEAGPASEGAWNCGSSCTGSAPSLGNGTYPCRFTSAPYGVYTGMGTAASANCSSSSPQVQTSQYVTLTSPTPTLVGISVAPVTFANTLVVGGTFLFNATCAYSDNTSFNCFPSTDQWGNTVTHWASSVPGVMTIGDIGSAQPGLATGISMGQSFIQATVTGPHLSSLWGVTINAAPPAFGPNSSSKVFSR